MPYIPFFLFISMPPKKRKRTDNTNRPKGRGRLFLEEVYTFDADQLTSDFVLTHGHIWYYLVTHQFDIHETTTLLKPLYNSVQKSCRICYSLLLFSSTKIMWNCYIYTYLSLYTLFSDGIGLLFRTFHLHFFRSWIFCHSHVPPYPLLHSL